ALARLFRGREFQKQPVEPGLFRRETLDRKPGARKRGVEFGGRVAVESDQKAPRAVGVRLGLDAKPFAQECRSIRGPAGPNVQAAVLAFEVFKPALQD